MQIKHQNLKRTCEKVVWFCFLLHVAQGWSYPRGELLRMKWHWLSFGCEGWEKNIKEGCNGECREVVKSWRLRICFLECCFVGMIENNILLPYVYLCCLCCHCLHKLLFHNFLFLQCFNEHWMINVAFGPFCALTHQRLLLLHKNSIANVPIWLISWIIICAKDESTLWGGPKLLSHCTVFQGCPCLNFNHNNIWANFSKLFA
jgi:hypothetical protein